MFIVSRAGSGCRPDNRQQHRNGTSRNNYRNQQHGHADRNDDNITGNDRNSGWHTEHPIANYDYHTGNDNYSGSQHDNSAFWRDFTGNKSGDAGH